MPPRIEPAVNRPAVPWAGATLTAEVDVAPGEQVVAVQRVISLCIDTSGSMGGEKIERARDGVAWVLGLLDPDDYVSIVAFDSAAELVMRPTRWGDSSREEAMEYVNELTAGGGTDMFDGFETAREALEAVEYQVDPEGTVRRILVLSDGKDKHHEPSDFADLAREIDEAGIRIKAAGIGAEYNEDTIRELGTKGRGEWTHLEGPFAIEDFFGDAVEDANEVVAPDARLELDVANGVEVEEVYRALPQAQEVDLDWAANTATVKLPDLVEREHQKVTMKLHAPAMDGEDEENHVLADLTLTAREAETTAPLIVTYTDDNSKLAAENEEVQLDHQQTVVKTELGKGNVDAAETEVERMTMIHGEDVEAVREIERQTQIVREGGRAERNRVTKIVEEDQPS
ncbi:MAG: vWA domain-containing protein [Haloarculaceae archaeon]